MVSSLQSVNFTKVVCHASVVAGDSHVAIPAGSGFEMPRSFRQALQAFRLTDFDIYPDAGNLQLPDAAVRVIEIVRQCKGGGGGGDHRRGPEGELPQPPAAGPRGGGAVGRASGYPLAGAAPTKHLTNSVFVCNLRSIQRKEGVLHEQL